MRRDWSSYEHGIWHELPCQGRYGSQSLRSALYQWGIRQELPGGYKTVFVNTHWCPDFPNRILFRIGKNINVNAIAPCDGDGNFCLGSFQTREVTCTCGHGHSCPGRDIPSHRL